jgi:hypothetical protein
VFGPTGDAWAKTAQFICKHLICSPFDLDTKAALELFVARATGEAHKDIEGAATMFRAFAISPSGNSFMRLGGRSFEHYAVPDPLLRL